MFATDPLATLRTFRAELYACFEQRADALFELMDAVLTAGPVTSPAHLSLEAVHRRGWGSVYDALALGRIDTEACRALLARQPLAAGQPIYAVDVSVWPRCDAETSPARGFYYHPARHSAGRPIVAGWAYQWVAQLSFARDSWTAPVDVQRVHPRANANQAAAEQIKALVRRLAADGPVPLFVFDAGYDPVQLAQALGDTRAAILVRLRSDRCFYADPLAAPPAPQGGRPRRHGAKLDCKDPTTWPPPTAEHSEEDPQYGHVRVRAWAGLHPKQQEHATRGTRRPRPIMRGTLVLVEVTRLPGRTRKPKVLWLWWAGPGTPALAVLWRAYVRRFDLEHTFRLLKQTLNWTVPRVRLPEQADRWTWLLVTAYTQLRLAQPCVRDQRLPWERRRPPETLTPYRVRRAFLALLMVVGTPTTAPKPCGRSPGRPRGRRSGPAPRYPALKKTA
jgi:Transposase DDE domain